MFGGLGWFADLGVKGSPQTVTTFQLGPAAEAAGRGSRSGRTGRCRCARFCHSCPSASEFADLLRDPRGAVAWPGGGSGGPAAGPGRRPGWPTTKCSRGENARVGRSRRRRSKAEAEEWGLCSKPPSHDPKRQSTPGRGASGSSVPRRVGERGRAGKQPGTPAITLAMTDNPDVVVDHGPERCADCGATSATAPVLARAPPSGDRPARGHPDRDRASGPDPRLLAAAGRRSPQTSRPGCAPRFAHGPRVRAVVAYLLARQHIPVERAGEAIRDLFGVKISTGTVTRLAPVGPGPKRGDPFLAAWVAQAGRAGWLSGRRCAGDSR